MLPSRCVAQLRSSTSPRTRIFRFSSECSHSLRRSPHSCPTFSADVPRPQPCALLHIARHLCPCCAMPTPSSSHWSLVRNSAEWITHSVGCRATRPDPPYALGEPRGSCCLVQRS